MDENNLPQTYRICKVRILPAKENRATQAFVDVRIGPFVIHGWAIIRTRKGGLFVGPPARLDPVTKRNYPYCSINEDEAESFYKAAIRAYNLELKRPAES